MYSVVKFGPLDDRMQVCPRCWFIYLLIVFICLLYGIDALILFNYTDQVCRECTDKGLTMKVVLN